MLKYAKLKPNMIELDGQIHTVRIFDFEEAPYQRQTVLARMEFNADGSIKPIDPLQAPF